MPEGFLAPRDYRQLLSYRKAEVVYDLTYLFCKRFLTKGDRTIDQMIQAARSGKQNIAEGSRAGLTSKESEIKLTNVARASLEELLIDYQDFLRVRALPLWDKSSRETRYVRRLGSTSGKNECFEIYREFAQTRPPRSSPTSPCASSTKPTSFSISSSAAWRPTSSTTAASARP